MQQQDEPQPGELQQKQQQDELQPGEVQQQDEPQAAEVLQQQQQNGPQPGELQQKQQQEDEPQPGEVQQQVEPQPGEVQQQQQQNGPQPVEVQQQQQQQQNGPQPAEVQQQQQQLQNGPQPGEVQQQQNGPQPGEVQHQHQQNDPQPVEVQQQQQQNGPQPVEVQQQQQNGAQPVEVQQQQQQQQQNGPQPGEAQQQQPQATAVVDTLQRMRPDECSVCSFIYNEPDRRPRTLPCGHTYCSLCMTLLLEDGHLLICPSCRAEHYTCENISFPINYGMEAVVRVLRAQQVEAASQTSGRVLQATGEAPQGSSRDFQTTEPETKQRKAAGLSRKLCSIVQEQKESIKSLENTLEKKLQQLNHYQAKLAVSRTKHVHQLQELDILVQQHQTNINLLQEEGDKMKSFVEKGEAIQMELSTAQSQLDLVNTAQEASTTIDVADNTIVKSEEWLQHSREEIPNGTVLSSSFKVMEATKAALKVITEETEDTPDQVTSGHSNCTIMEAVDSIEGEEVELEHVHTMRLRRKVEAGKVFATEKYADDTYYSSKVTCKESKMYLHALKNEPPQRKSCTIQVSKALENIKYHGLVMFLDLAWPGTSPQRVHIKLVGDTPLTRQFVTLCLGHTGLTYCNTKLISVEYYDRKRIIWGGDISGQEAAANQVLPPIQGNKCGGAVVINPGMVVARTNLFDAAKRTRFGIALNHIDSYFNNPPVFLLGIIDADGQGVVDRAANNNSGGITQVKVEDCGLAY